MKSMAAIGGLVVLCLMVHATAQDEGFGVPGVRGGVAPRPAAGWGQAELVVVARLDEAIAGPVGMSMPPLHTHTLRMTVEKALRGEAREGDALSAGHSARQELAPVFPVGKRCVIAMRKDQHGFRAERIEEATAERIAEVTLLCQLPLGWTSEDGKVVSPWAAQGNKAWPADQRDPSIKMACAKTGRPAYLAGGIRFTVEKVPPAREIKWTNPDGDGEYRITVTNSTEKPLAVPALLSVDGRILWEESLVILCQKKAYVCPGSQGVNVKVSATTIEPGKSVSTVINALRLQGPEWPRGGYRIEFQFCLGEKSSTQSFYYMSRHHDPLRAAAQKLN